MVRHGRRVDEMFDPEQLKCYRDDIQAFHEPRILDIGIPTRQFVRRAMDRIAREAASGKRREGDVHRG
jgi:hypothetical protein